MSHRCRTCLVTLGVATIAVVNGGCAPDASHWDPFRGMYEITAFENGDCGASETDISDRIDEPLVVAEVLGPARPTLWVVACESEEVCEGVAADLQSGTAPYEGSIVSVVDYVEPLTEAPVDLDGCDAQRRVLVFVERLLGTLTVADRTYEGFTLEGDCSQEAALAERENHCTFEEELTATWIAPL